MKTADILGNLSMRLSQIADAVHETDRDVANELSDAAKRIMLCSTAIEDRITKYAASALKPD